MAIYGIAGRPGSGKTFWAINHMVSKYFEWNKIHSEFFKKVQVEIVSNIENLKLDHYNLDEMIEKAGGQNKFFTIEYQRELLKRFPKILYIIDEAGRYFPSKFSDEKVLAFFQYHRHLGIDFYLIAPGVSMISTGIVRLMEYRIQATSQSKRVLGEFRYRKVIEGDDVGRMVLNKDKRIFEIYRSMDMEGVEKIGSVTRKYIVMIIVLVLVAVGSFTYFMNKIIKGSKAGQALALEKRALLKGKAENKEKATIGGGGPLPEGGSRGGAARSEMVEVVFRDEGTENNLRVEFSKAMVFKLGDGNILIGTNDGEMIRGELIPNMIKRGELVLVGDSAYVRNKGGVGTGVHPARTTNEPKETQKPQVKGK